MVKKSNELEWKLKASTEFGKFFKNDIIPMIIHAQSIIKDPIKKRKEIEKFLKNEIPSFLQHLIVYKFLGLNPITEKIRNELKEQELGKKIKEYSREEFEKSGYGFAVPLEIIEKGNLFEELSKSEAFKNFYIKNPEIGSILEQLRQDFNLNKARFSKLLKINQGDYYKVIKNQQGINLQKLFKISKKLMSPKYLSQNKIKEYKNRIEDILTNKESIISNKKIKINFNPDDLEKIRINNKIHVILPTSKYEIKRERDIIKNYISEYFKKHKKPPTRDHIRSKYGAFINFEYASGRTYNDFLKESNFPLRHELKYNWSDPKNREMVKNWVLIFNKTHGSPPIWQEMHDLYGGFLNYEYRAGRTFNDFLKECGLTASFVMIDWSDPENREMVKNWVLQFFKERGRPPKFKELKSKYGYFLQHEREKGRTFNDFLKECGITPLYKREYDWSDPANREIVKNWVLNFNKTHKKPPKAKELKKQFGGFLKYEREAGRTFNDFLRECGITPLYELKYDWSDPINRQIVKNWVHEFFKEYGRPPIFRELHAEYGGFLLHEQKKGRKFNDFIRECGLPVIDIEESIKEGMEFQNIATESLKTIYKSIKPFYRVHHPILVDFGKKFVVPDAIIHDFNKKPIKQKGKSYYLKEGDKFDRILEIKRSFGGISTKEREIYSKLAKRIDIYLLQGTAENFKWGESEVVYHSRQDLLNLLESIAKKEPSKEEKIRKLIEKIENIDKKIDEKQTRISDFLNKF